MVFLIKNSFEKKIKRKHNEFGLVLYFLTQIEVYHSCFLHNYSYIILINRLLYMEKWLYHLILNQKILFMIYLSHALVRELSMQILPKAFSLKKKKERKKKLLYDDYLIIYERKPT